MLRKYNAYGRYCQGYVCTHRAVCVQRVAFSAIVAEKTQCSLGYNTSV